MYTCSVEAHEFFGRPHEGEPMGSCSDAICCQIERSMVELRDALCSPWCG